MVLFTCNVKKIKGAAHIYANVDGTCKRTFTCAREQYDNQIQFKNDEFNQIYIICIKYLSSRDVIYLFIQVG